MSVYKYSHASVAKRSTGVGIFSDNLLQICCYANERISVNYDTLSLTFYGTPGVCVYIMEKKPQYRSCYKRDAV